MSEDTPREKLKNVTVDVMRDFLAMSKMCEQIKRKIDEEALPVTDEILKDQALDLETRDGVVQMQAMMLLMSRQLTQQQETLGHVTEEDVDELEAM